MELEVGKVYLANNRYKYGYVKEDLIHQGIEGFKVTYGNTIKQAVNGEPWDHYSQGGVCIQNYAMCLTEMPVKKKKSTSTSNKKKKTPDEKRQLTLWDL